MFTTNAYPTTDKDRSLWSMKTAVSPSILNQYKTISLNEMSHVALQNRTDTKFVMSITTLQAALGQLHSAYRMLAINGVRLHPYQTIYFDTADFDLYKRHHAGIADRYKVRSRAYMDTALAFFEVKHKTNKNRTVKDRVQTAQLQTRVNRETAVFLQHHYPYEPAALLPVLINNFARITLVSNQRPERLTLDFGITFQQGDQTTTLPGVAIAEVKQEGFSQRSAFIQQMRALGVRPTAFSKYCHGINELYPNLKQNNFKPRHLLLQKIYEEEPHGYN